MTKKITGTIDEAAVILKVSRNSAYEGVKTGEIPSMRIGKRIIVLWIPFLRSLGVGDEEVARAAKATERDDVDADGNDAEGEDDDDEDEEEEAA